MALNFTRYIRLDDFIVVHLASAPVTLCGCALPYEEECNATRCRACRVTMDEIALWASHNVRDRHGARLGRLYVRRALSNYIELWNFVRRGQLDRRRRERPRVDFVVAARTPIPAGECAICLEDVVRGEEVYLPCMHSFHSVCINRWMRNRPTCPTCRYQFPPLAR